MDQWLSLEELLIEFLIVLSKSAKNKNYPIDMMRASQEPDLLNQLSHEAIVIVNGLESSGEIRN